MVWQHDDANCVELVLEYRDQKPVAQVRRASVGVDASAYIEIDAVTRLAGPMDVLSCVAHELHVCL